MSPFQKSVLIIEHDPYILRVVGRILQEAGYVVLAARKALEGLDVARKQIVDIFLLDLDLPDLNGRQLATMLRAERDYVRTPIVAIVEADTDEERELSFAAGINGFLEKPINANALALQVQFFLSGGQDVMEDEERLDSARQRYVQEVVMSLENRIRELEAKNEELERLDSMKDTFIQLTAHELRTPLTLITGYSRLIEDYPALQHLMDDDGEIAQLVQGLSDGIGRMQGIIEDILIISRIMTSKLELNVVPISLAQVFRKAIHTFEEALRERHIELVFDEGQFSVPMRADGDLLSVIAVNLVSNAIKYTPDGGRIIISVSSNNQVVRFSVKDTGIGIEPERQGDIFNRFHIGGDIELHTTSKTAFGGGGLGLGLAICKGIVEAHGGKIWVESPGMDKQHYPGSEFIVVLPLIAMPKQSGSANAPRIKRLVARS